MSPSKWRATISKGQLQQQRDWLGDLLGLCLITGIWAIMPFLGFLGAATLSSKIVWLCIALSLPSYAIYCLSKENDLTPVETSLSSKDNRKLVVAAFRTLGWDVHTNTKYIVTAGANNKWWRGAGQTATAILADNRVYLNIIHGGTVKGRMPFYFGSNRRKLKRAIATIQQINSLPVAWLR